MKNKFILVSKYRIKNLYREKYISFLLINSRKFSSDIEDISLKNKSKYKIKLPEFQNDINFNLDTKIQLNCKFLL